MLALVHGLTTETAFNGMRVCCRNMIWFIWLVHEVWKTSHVADPKALMMMMVILLLLHDLLFFFPCHPLFGLLSLSLKFKMFSFKISLSLASNRSYLMIRNLSFLSFRGGNHLWKFGLWAGYCILLASFPDMWWVWKSLLLKWHSVVDWHDVRRNSLLLRNEPCTSGMFHSNWDCHSNWSDT